jgi:3-oxoadipate enol-lactonase
MSSRVAVRRGRAPVEGTDLYYEVAGAGPWMVFVHGGEGSRLHWWQQVPFFAGQFTCVTYDCRGFGASPPGRVPAGDSVQRDDLVALLDHLEVDRAVLVGHSMGGGAVSAVAQTFPDRVERLVMSDSPFGFVTTALVAWAGQMFDKIPAGFDVLEHLYAPGFDEREPALAYIYQGLNRLNPPRQGPRGLESYERWSHATPVDYTTFSVPTLFVVGTEDELTLPWLIRATAEAVGGSQLVQIDGAGHSGYAERADAFNAAVLQFCGD